MKKKAKRIVEYLMLAALLVVNIFNFRFDAKADGASVSIGLSAGTVNVGDTVTVSVTVRDAYDARIALSYNSAVLQYTGGSGAAVCNGGGGAVNMSGPSGTTTLSFKAIAPGTSYVGTSGSDVCDDMGEIIPVSHGGANITVNGASAPSQDPGTPAPETPATTEDDGKSKNCNLVSLQVAPGTLEPAFSYNVTNYFLQVEKDVTSISVTAKAEDDKSKVSVSGANELHIGENIVKVVVTAENGSTKTYSIRVAVGPLLEDVEITIDKVKYHIVNSVDGLEPPESFTETTMQYKDWEILAFESPNKLIKIVGLKATVKEEVDGEEQEVEKVSWFMYDEINDEFTPYIEVASSQNRFVILPVPEGIEIPEHFVEKEVTVQGQKVIAYQSEYATDDNIFLVYANNINGSEGFYWYDRTEGSFLRYCPDEEPEPQVEEATKTDATPTDIPQNVRKVTDDEGFFTKRVLSFILYGVSALLLLFITLFVVQVGKKKALREDLEQAESMVDQLTAAKDADKADAAKLFAVDAEANAETNAETTETAETSETADAAPAEEKPEANKDYDFIPEISLVNYEEESNALKESMKDNYDANLDSAFPEDAVTAAEAVVEETKTEVETVAEAVEEKVEEKVEEVTEKTDEA